MAEWRRLDAAGRAEQTDHLTPIATRPNVTIDVLPFAAEVPIGPLNMFSIYDDRLAASEDKTGRSTAATRRAARRPGSFIRSIADDCRRDAT